MNKEFVVGSVKIIEDEEGFGVAVAVDTNKKDDGNPYTWEVIASFKYPLDAVRYFNELVNTLGSIAIEEENK